MPKPTTKLGTPHQVLKMSRAALLVSVALTGGLAGCAIGPNYQRAPMDLPEQYPNATQIDTSLPE